jgi:magnesium chelatase subunit I
MLHSKTLGELKAAGYTPKSTKDELRDNLIKKLQAKETVFQGILGFENTVLPDVERAILSRHSILLLGLRGQAKTRIARQLVDLLDEYIPIVAGSELNDDPMNPLSRYAKDLIAEKGDKTPITWLHRMDRYVEKLATPDVSVADLIGDVDPILAANLKLPYSDERVIHFGLVPRAHRCIFVINELPDLQARIQVSLFNILQEGDIQIRGFKLRLPLDIQFCFTANPEDYTNRGSIITPLKDRIQSQILTHYPEDLDIARQITEQEAKPAQAQRERVTIPLVLKDLIEQIASDARESEYVDSKSGVSTRLSISALENLYSAAERRAILNGEKHTTARITDFWGIVPAITGKIELVYEGEQEGPYQVAMHLFSTAIKQIFLLYFPNPEELKRKSDKDPYGVTKAYFAGGNVAELMNDATEKDFKLELEKIKGLEKLVKEADIDDAEKHTFMELCLHGLSEYNVVTKEILDSSFSFGDLLSGMLDDLDDRNN